MRRLFFCIALSANVLAWSQGTVEDYKRAYSVRSKMSGKILHGDVRAHAIEGTHKFWYSETGTEGANYKLVDCETAEVSDLFDKSELCSQLSEKTGWESSPRLLNLGELRYRKSDESNPHDALSFEYGGKRWRYDLTDKSLNEGESIRRFQRSQGQQRHWMEVPDEKEGWQQSPDGTVAIYHKDNNLWICP